VAVLATTFATTRDRRVQPATPTSVAAETTVPAAIDSTTIESTVPAPAGPPIDGRQLIDATWTVVSIDGAGVTRFRRPPSFVLHADGSLTGIDGCNTYGFDTHSWTIDSDRLTLKAEGGSTADKCDVDGIMPFSTTAANALALDETGTVLTITNAHVVVATRTPIPTTREVTLSNIPIDQPHGTVLATFPADQLGVEKCQECLASEPYLPQVTDDGVIIIPDTVNKRWVVVRDGALSFVPLPQNTQWVGQPLLVDKIIYSPERKVRAAGGADNVIAEYDVDDLSTVVLTADVPELTFADPELVLSGDAVTASGIGIAKVAPALAAPTVALQFGSTPPSIEVTWKGASVTTTFSSGDIDVANVSPLLQATRDGSVYLMAGASDATNTNPGTLLIRMHPDGHLTATRYAGLATMFGSPQVTDHGVVQLVGNGGQYQVIRYDLPA
jgi:heat shock protein HslJ